MIRRLGKFHKDHPEYSWKITRLYFKLKYCSSYYSNQAVEENYIPPETQSQANTPVTPSEPEGNKGKEKRHSEGLITAKKWTPIATQRNRKPQNLLQYKDIFKNSRPQICTGHSKRDLGCQRNQPEVRESLSRTRRHGRGHLGHSGGWQDTEGGHTDSTIHFPIQQEPQTRGLERYGSSSSAPPTPQRFISMEHRQQEVQPGIPLGRAWSKLPEDMSQRDRLQSPYCEETPPVWDK
ncbi:hypothetical protein O181_047557 [Austropuccinia psidii MF-1]|uniref:Uncharacterized protein n=1 Tax=Austropuccinia psidii MF-1 TaxID=1389203 RepID=A0A9Q3DY24_9BASI|nr:hypothetical protein [Austropuccinia psidii MF-1]